MNEKYKALVSKLPFPHHVSGAYQALLNCGLGALPAVQTGSRHKSADVRYRCCQFLDHYLMPEIIDDLVAMLDDPDHRVRCAALHTVTCDRCKEGSCRPEEAKVLPRAIELWPTIRIPMSAPWQSRWWDAGFIPVLRPRPRF